MVAALATTAVPSFVGMVARTRTISSAVHAEPATKEKPKETIITGTTTDLESAIVTTEDDMYAEAEATNRLFMSLDSDEFGIDVDYQPKEEKPKVKDTWEKTGDAMGSLSILGVFTVLTVIVTGYTFFTKQAEEAFYYSTMADRAGRFGPEESEGAGTLDFRSFDSKTVDKAVKNQAKPAPEMK